jgi:hypothetical protein
VISLLQVKVIVHETQMQCLLQEKLKKSYHKTLESSNGCAPKICKGSCAAFHGAVSVI